MADYNMNALMDALGLDSPHRRPYSPVSPQRSPTRNSRNLSTRLPTPLIDAMGSGFDVSGIPEVPPRPARTPFGTPSHRLSPRVRSPNTSPTRNPPRSPTKQAPVKRFRITFVIDAPDVRDDFYSTTVASRMLPPLAADPDNLGQSQNIDHNAYVAVALGAEVKLWSHQLGASPTFLPWTNPVRPVTSLSISSRDWTAVGYDSGLVYVYDVLAQVMICQLHLNDREVMRAINLMCQEEPSTFVQRYASALLWLDDTTLVLGDSRGGLHQYNVSREVSAVHRLQRQSTHRKHSELVCSLALDCNGVILAVGANDNAVSLWEVRRTAAGTNLRYYDMLAQPSAIKGLTFCPYLPRLLVLGTGRFSRRILVYNAEAGKIILDIPVPGQVVATVWLSRWDLFVGIGHSRQQFQVPGTSIRKEFSGLGVVYRLPKGEPVAIIEHKTLCGRALNAVRMGSETCVLTSRGKLVFFAWKPDLIPSPACELLVSAVRSPMSPSRPMR